MLRKPKDSKIEVVAPKEEEEAEEEDLTVSKCCHVNMLGSVNQENCALLGYYAASSDNSRPTFRDNLTVPSSWSKNPRILLGLYGPTMH